MVAGGAELDDNGDKADLDKVDPGAKMKAKLQAGARDVDRGSRPFAQSWHNYLMLLAVASILAGYYVIHRNKDLNGKPHWKTTHGQLGVFLVVFLVG